MDVWLLMGVLAADPANANEPETAGLDGDYIGIAFWMWVYQQA